MLRELKCSICMCAACRRHGQHSARHAAQIHVGVCRLPVQRHPGHWLPDRPHPRRRRRPQRPAMFRRTTTESVICWMCELGASFGSQTGGAAGVANIASEKLASFIAACCHCDTRQSYMAIIGPSLNAARQGRRHSSRPQRTSLKAYLEISRGRCGQF